MPRRRIRRGERQFGTLRGTILLLSLGVLLCFFSVLFRNILHVMSIIGQSLLFVSAAVFIVLGALSFRMYQNLKKREATNQVCTERSISVISVAQSQVSYNQNVHQINETSYGNHAMDSRWSGSNLPHSTEPNLAPVPAPYPQSLMPTSQYNSQLNQQSRCVLKLFKW